MFCPHCGKQIPDDARFCGGCGAQVGAPKKAPVVNKPPVAPKISVPKISVPNITLPGGRMEELKTRSLFFFGSLLTMFLSIFFTLGMHLEAKATLWGITETERTSAFLDVPVLKVLSIILFVAGIVLALLPLIIGGKWKLWNQIPAVGAAGLNTLWLLFVLIASKLAARNSGYGSNLVKVHLTFGGVMFLLLNVATIALSVMSFLKDSKNGMKFL